MPKKKEKGTKEGKAARDGGLVNWTMASCASVSNSHQPEAGDGHLVNDSDDCRRLSERRHSLEIARYFVHPGSICVKGAHFGTCWGPSLSLSPGDF